MPIFSMIPASRTEPIVGASVWASGSHVWTGHIGTLTASPRAIAPNTISWKSWENPPRLRERLQLQHVEGVCAPGSPERRRR